MFTKLLLPIVSGKSPELISNFNVEMGWTAESDVAEQKHHRGFPVFQDSRGWNCSPHHRSTNNRCICLHRALGLHLLVFQHGGKYLVPQLLLICVLAWKEIIKMSLSHSLHMQSDTHLGSFLLPCIFVTLEDCSLISRLIFIQGTLSIYDRKNKRKYSKKEWSKSRKPKKNTSHEKSVVLLKTTLRLTTPSYSSKYEACYSGISYLSRQNCSCTQFPLDWNVA